MTQLKKENKSLNVSYVHAYSWLFKLKQFFTFNNYYFSFILSYFRCFILYSHEQA